MKTRLHIASTLGLLLLCPAPAGAQPPTPAKGGEAGAVQTKPADKSAKKGSTPARTTAPEAKKAAAPHPKRANEPKKTANEPKNAANEPKKTTGEPKKAAAEPKKAAAADKTRPGARKKNPLKTPADLVEALEGDRARLQQRAIRLVVRRRVKEAAPALRKLLGEGKGRLRLAALQALVRLRDQGARPAIVALMRGGGRGMARRAEQALIALDRAQGRPRVFLAVGVPRVGPGVPEARAEQLRQKVLERLARSDYLVVSAGEETALGSAQLQRHLRKRRLDGMLVLAHLKKLQRKTDARQVTFAAEVSLITATLDNRRMTFSAWGDARSQVKARSRSEAMMQEVEERVLDAALGAATRDVMAYLEEGKFKRRGPRR